MSRYGELSKAELVALLEQRDRRDATRFGLVWEAKERDAALNDDFVALDLDAGLSCGTAPWRNLIVEGDNYDALRHLRMAFAGRVKCIYIDPPYNTGNRDFVYNDRFVDREDAWRHSKWCDFMFRRLQLAKRLLAPDGAIFVSIDDNECATLRLLMDKVFGERNFIASFIWRKVDSPNDNKVPVTPDHELILCYAANAASVSLVPMPAPQIVEAYGSVDEGGRRFRDRLLKKNGKNSLRKDRPTMFFALLDPDGNEVFPQHDNGEEACWAMGRDGIAKKSGQGLLVWKKREKGGIARWEPYTREFAPEVPTRPYPTIWSDLPTMRQAKAMLRELFGSADLFSTPKPVELIERILRVVDCGPDDLVLDFFAGSGTTAHAVHRLNAADGGRRRCILVSSTESTVAEPDKNLCRDVCAQRVRRVVEGFNGTPGLGGDFAYLRCRRVPAGRLLKLDHEAVWTALQLVHRERLAPYDAEAPYQYAEEDGRALAYVPRFRPGDAEALRRRLDTATAAAVFSWQPESLRQQVPGAHIEHESVAEYLGRKFGAG